MDIFSRRTTFNGGFNMISTQILFAGFKTGLSFSNVGVGYNQQIVRIWDLDGSSGNTYLIAGHAMGQATVGKTIGPSNTGNAFYQRYSDICQANQNTLMLNASTSCSSNPGAASSQFGGTLKMTLTGVVINGITLSADANDPVIRQSLGMTFISMDWDEQTGAQRSAQQNLAAA
jgi:hypothetical protein